jgi:hypothetical protein
VYAVDATSKIAVEAREDRLIATIEVAATREMVWTVLTDFDAWTRTFPEIEWAHVRRLDDDRVEVAHATSSFVERRLVSRSAADTVEALAREVERRCLEARMASAN